MYGENPDDVMFYVTLYNENYAMPAIDEGDLERVRDGVIRGLYRFAPQSSGAPEGDGPNRSATMLFSGSAWHETMRAREILASEWGVSTEAWSATNYKSLREEALEIERWNRLHPSATPRVPHVTKALASATGPIIAVSDFMKAVPDQISRFVEAPYTSLGTDGFGRSDTREALRRHFEIDAEHIVVAVLSSLAKEGSAKSEEVADAIARYGIDPEAIDPRHA
jgi:pyruvate dehydrogenase E1 component